MYLGLISTVLTEYDASKYALCTFFHFTMRYTGILRTLEILYMCARECLLLRPNKITKKSFLLNDLHLRNRDKPLTTILFLCYDFGFFIYLVKANCHVVVVCASFFLLFLFFLDLGPATEKCICQLKIVELPY